MTHVLKKAKASTLASVLRAHTVEGLERLSAVAAAKEYASELLPSAPYVDVTPSSMFVEACEAGDTAGVVHFGGQVRKIRVRLHIFARRGPAVPTTVRCRCSCTHGCIQR